MAVSNPGKGALFIVYKKNPSEMPEVFEEDKFNEMKEKYFKDIDLSYYESSEIKPN